LAIHVQINPTAEAVQVSHRLADVLDERAIDFDIRYCCLEPTPETMSELRAIAPQNAEEAGAIAAILEGLERGEGVELLYSA
jgi:hypothetical protein